MKKHLLWVPAGLALIIAILAGIKAMQIGAMIKQGKKFVPPPETVTATQVKTETWPADLTAVGTLTAVQGVTVAAELVGKVVKIGFEPGTAVKKGDLLVRQDISSEEAQLPGLTAQVKLARTELARDDKMLAEKIISQSDYDKAAATLRPGCGPSQQHPDHHRQEDHPRPLHRAPRHPPGQPRPDTPRGGPHRYPADTQPDLCRFHPAPAADGPGACRPAGAGDV